MKVGIVVFGNDSKLKKGMETAALFSTVLSERGYFPTVINTSLDTDKKLTLFDYLIFVGETKSYFSTAFNSSLKKYLNNAGNISGKRAATVLTGGMLMKNRAMRSLMEIIEGEGVILKTSCIAHSKADALSFIKTINVERNY